MRASTGSHSLGNEYEGSRGLGVDVFNGLIRESNPNGLIPSERWSVIWKTSMNFVRNLAKCYRELHPWDIDDYLGGALLNSATEHTLNGLLSLHMSTGSDIRLGSIWGSFSSQELLIGIMLPETFDERFIVSWHIPNLSMLVLIVTCNIDRMVITF